MPVSVFAADLIKRAAITLQIIAPGENLQGDEASDCLLFLNDMMDGFATRRLTIYTTPRFVYPLVGGQGGPSTPYTIGPGGNFNQPWPEWISEAGVILNTTTPAYERPLDVLTMNEYAHLGVKTLTASIISSIYYDRGFSSTGLGNIYTFPVNDGSQSLSLALYIPQALGQFADLNTTPYLFPPGYPEALGYQLAKRMAGPYNTTLTPEAQQLAADTFGFIQKANARMPNLRCDPALTGNGRGAAYNWRTGSFGNR